MIQNCLPATANYKIGKKAKYYLIGLGIAVVATVITIYVALGVYNPLYVVVSKSMVPTLNVGDVVVINHNIPYNTLRVGDIIVFQTPGVTPQGEHKIIVHRIVQIVVEPNGDVVIRTKGDANPGVIPGLDWPIDQRDYKGKAVYVLPKVGLLSNTLTKPVGYILIGIVIIFLVYRFKRSRSFKTRRI